MKENKMVKIEDVMDIMRKIGNKAPQFDLHPRDTNLFFLSAWQNEPLLCSNTKYDKLLMVTISDGIGNLFIQDLSSKNATRIKDVVPVSVEAKFDNWREARDYFRDKSKEEGDAYDLYAKLAYERYMKCTIAVIR